jgi:hypothetical protein
VEFIPHLNERNTENSAHLIAESSKAILPTDIQCNSESNKHCKNRN